MTVKTTKPNTPPTGGDAKPEGGARGSSKSWIWILMLFVLLYLVVSQLSDGYGGRDVRDVDFNRFVAELEARENVKKVEEVSHNVFVLTLKNDMQLPVTDEPGAELRPFGKLRCATKDGNYFSERLGETLKALPPDTVFFKVPGDPFLTVILMQILPFLLLFALFWYMAGRVRKQMGGPGFFGRFGGNRAKRFEKDKSVITFRDVASLKNVKQELLEIVSFLKHPERYSKLGAKIPKGVLLVGPPGTGKTLLARAVAGEAGVPFFSISGSEFIELFVGMGASRVRELFDEAKKSSPCIVFIDEIDAVGRSRGAGLGGGHDEREQTLNQILSEMDGFETNENVIVLAATNRPDVLDPALVRPGRFDRQVVVERPQRDGRKQILQVHTRNIPLGPDVDLDTLARATIGFSGADLRNLANEAALLAAREGKEQVVHRDFERAKDKILLGTLRDESMNQQDKRLTAYHESGHALLALLLPGADPVQSVTIVPRGRTLGVTMQLPVEDINSYSRTYLTNRVVIMLGGRAAEELVFGEFTTGAENDLMQSTGLVERMVCRWGMSEKLGPVSFRRGEEHVFLGRELGETKHFSEHTAMLIDDEIRRLIDKAYQTALELLRKERVKLEKLAEELLEKEVLSDREIYTLLGFALPKSLEPDSAETNSSPTPKPAAAKPAARAAGAEPTSNMTPDMLGLEGA
ncbi:MAG: ATP-dependent zinc metalloprotease FtsH [Planctomycetota bacterium]